MPNSLKWAPHRWKICFSDCWEVIIKSQQVGRGGGGRGGGGRKSLSVSEESSREAEWLRKVGAPLGTLLPFSAFHKLKFIQEFNINIDDDWSKMVKKSSKIVMVDRRSKKLVWNSDLSLSSVLCKAALETIAYLLRRAIGEGGKGFFFLQIEFFFSSYLDFLDCVILTPGAEHWVVQSNPS